VNRFAMSFAFLTMAFFVLIWPRMVSERLLKMCFVLGNDPAWMVEARRRWQ